MDIGLIAEIAFKVVGGLGIFLLGMKNMSDGMQAVAGERLRKLINAVTNNRLMACGVGTLVTCLIQSSSITTVMVVGMVNAGIMTLFQAIGVILGANIGTTITGWIIALKIGKYGLPLIGISAIFYLFSNKERVRYLATLALGLGLVFFGLELMKDGFKPLRDMEGFIALFSHFSPDSYFGVIKCCLVGAVLTAIVQSSSATLGITIGLATVGVINFPTAAALVLGENIGTTITALLASIGASQNAKRASIAHSIVNVFGVAWITTIFGLYIGFIVKLIGHDPAVQTIAADGTISYENAAACIAATHTVFNVVNVSVMLPIMGILANLLAKIVPDKHEPEPTHLTYLDVRMLDAPTISIQQSKKEIIRMGTINLDMMTILRDCIVNPEKISPTNDKIFEHERKLDYIQKEITEFLTTCLTLNLPYHAATEVTKQIRMADEYETVSDYIASILKLNLKILDVNDTISDRGLSEILDLHDKVTQYLVYINGCVKSNMGDNLPAAQTMGNQITHAMKEYRSNHLARVSSGEVQPLKSLAFTDMLNSYRRIKDHAYNIAEALCGEK